MLTSRTPPSALATAPALLDRVRAGDPHALAALYREHAGTAHRLAYRLLGSHEDAQEVVQDVFVGLPRALAKYEERGLFAAWLHRLVARVALMRLRAERRRRAAEPLPAPGPGELASSGADLVERLTIEAAVDALPEPLRIVFVLRAVVGYSHEEIAAALAIRVGTSKVRLHRAVRLLQRVLGATS